MRRCEQNISLHLLIELCSRDIGYFNLFDVIFSLSCDIVDICTFRVFHDASETWFWDWLTMDCKHVNEDFFDA